jgi:hypothetical protein
MAAPSHVWTISRAAVTLGVDIDILAELASTMTPEDGVLWICDDTEDGCIGFTSFGIDSAAAQLADPGIIDVLK